MKQSVRTTFMLVTFLLVSGSIMKAQTSQTVSIQPGYTNQTFYSMNNGVVSSVSNMDWDLGFQLRGFAASILINSKNNVKLYKADKAVSQWSSMTASDTTGIVSNPAYELFNSDTSWDFGAFNVTNDMNNAFDLGWGLYDFTTHAIVGDSIYFIKLATGDIKKLQIIDLASGTYNFRWADPDGSNEQVRSLSKSAYLGKHFAYYSIATDVAIDREPLINDWDLVFQQYMTLTPFIYKVTGVLSNDSVFVAKAYPVDVYNATSAGLTFEEEINTIGYDWKTFDMNTNTWIIADSTVYFVTDRAGATWKVVFTGFGGSANGDFYFDQTALTTSVSETSMISTLGIYPNPATDHARVMVNLINSGDVRIELSDVTGRLVNTMNVQTGAGIQGIDLDLNGMKQGVYQVSLISGSHRAVSRLVIN